MTLAADRLGTVIFVVLPQMDFPRGMGLIGKVEGCAWRHLVTYLWNRELIVLPGSFSGFY